MKTILTLLMTLAVGFSGRAQAPRPLKTGPAKPKVKTVFDPEKMALMLEEITLPRLRKIYGKAVQVKKVTRNKYEPAVRDTLLTVVTKADKLEFFTNKYNQFLLSANLTSQKLTFGHAIRVGSPQAAFCKAYGLSAAFNDYQLTDESSGSLDFIFRQGVLAEVSYHVGSIE